MARQAYNSMKHRWDNAATYLFERPCKKAIMDTDEHPALPISFLRPSEHGDFNGAPFDEFGIFYIDGDNLYFEDEAGATAHSNARAHLAAIEFMSTVNPVLGDGYTEVKRKQIQWHTHG